MKTVLIILLCLLLLLAVLILLLPIGKRKKRGFYGLAAYSYAHRGLHDIERGLPENSLRAFRLAAEYGYGAELDVHLSKDGRLVVMHDESLKRTAGVDRNIADCTAQELDCLRLQGTDEKIPYLEEVLPIFEGRTPLVIEIKAFNKNHAELTQRVCELLDRFPKLQFCIESFDPRVLLWLKKRRPAIVRGQLAANFIKERSGLSPITALLLTHLCMNALTLPHFVAYRFEDRACLGAAVSRRVWGVQEFSWTLRTVQAVNESKKNGALPIFEHCRPEL
ncbi:MAG: glycerophosphodiester phosphodiesterase [Oscillospiraceae bacterium]|nr:glycerophosphodiester phosphodiesterase [Oscillospiraceae bacterium]